MAAHESSGMFLNTAAARVLSFHQDADGGLVQGLYLEFQETIQCEN